jgi:hypothetical protein
VRFLGIVFLLAALASAADTIEIFGHHWTVQNAADWSVEGAVLKLIHPGTPPPGLPRRPQKFALAETDPFQRVTVEAEVRRAKRSLVIIYAWQDDAHFNYAHISSDTAEQQVHHNGIFHVFGGERVRISPLDGPAGLPAQDWKRVKLVFDGETGHCFVEIDGKRNPSLEAYDLSLRHGRIGLGSFDETGDFRNVRIQGVKRSGGTLGHR